MSMKAGTKGGSSTVMALAAAKIANQIIHRLSGIEQVLNQQLRLSQAPRKNFLAGGTIDGGGIIGTTPQTIMQPNYNRRGLNVQNTSAAGGPNLIIGIGNQSPVAGRGLTLLPGASWDGRLSGEVCIEAIAIVGSAAGCSYTWVYGTGENKDMAMQKWDLPVVGIQQNDGYASGGLAVEGQHLAGIQPQRQMSPQAAKYAPGLGDEPYKPERFGPPRFQPNQLNGSLPSPVGGDG